MRRQSIVCDVCGATKREVNHWFCVWIADRRITITNPEGVNAVLAQFGHDVCGEACLSKWITAHIQETYADR